MQNRQTKKLHDIGLDHAWEGIVYAFTRHTNFIIHLIISVGVILTAFILDLSEIKIILLVFAILIGLVVEMINTAIESIVDLVTDEWRQSAKIAKDVASGAMLLTAVGTSIIGLMILLPELRSLFS